MHARHPGLADTRLREIRGEFLDSAKVSAAALRKRHESRLEGFHGGKGRMVTRGHVGRIEQDEGIEAEADLERMLHRGTARHGVEDAGRPSVSEFRHHVLIDPLQIMAELRVGVVGGRRRFVLAVIAKVENDEVEAIQKMLPVRQIAVDGVAVAMTQEKPRAFRIAGTAKVRWGAGISRGIEGLLIPPRLRGGWPSAARSGGVTPHGQRAPPGAQKRATLPEDGEGFYRNGFNPNSSHRRATAAISASVGQTFGGNRASPRSGSGS